MELNYRVEVEEGWMNICFDSEEEEDCIIKMIGECRLKINQRLGKLCKIFIPIQLLVENYEFSSTYSEEVDIFMLYLVPRVDGRLYRVKETKDYLASVMMDLNEEGKIISFELMGFLFL